jgi:lauroyl/myristoyl acyltransferase
MADDELAATGRRLLRHFRWAERAWRWAPRGSRVRAATLVGRTFSPDLPEAHRIWAALQAFTDCSDEQAHSWLARYFSSQGLFAAELHEYPLLNAEWARTQVRCDERDVLDAVVNEGGLVLTYHSFHHNRLGAFLGLSGSRVYGIAGTEDNSPFKPWTGRYIRLLNGGSERCFGGGRYLFTDDLRGTLRESRAALRRGDALISLADNISGSPTAVPLDVVGRRLNMATGVIDLALEAGAPITLALFFSDLRGGHRCRLRRLGSHASAASVAHAYIDQLLGWCKDDVHAWQGWGWWDHMGFVPGTEVQGLELHSSALSRFAASRPSPSAAQQALLTVDKLEQLIRPVRP